MHPNSTYPPAKNATKPGADAFPEILTIEQTAEYLQLHPQVVYRHVRAGTLPASRIGRTIRFKKSVLDAFLERDAWKAVGAFIAFANAKQPESLPVAPAAESEGDLAGWKPALPDVKSPPMQFSADVD